ncbi:hypothetical protein [Persephonella sp.]
MIEETISKESAICPHCGYEHIDIWEVFDGASNGEIKEIDCPSCGKVYICEIDTTPTYYTKPKEE